MSKSPGAEYGLCPGRPLRRPEQTLYTQVDRGLRAMDYLGPSELYRTNQTWQDIDRESAALVDQYARHVWISSDFLPDNF
jgi:hypothetical protein